MSLVNIQVNGSHTISLPPERGVLRATIALEGGDGASVMRAVTNNVAAVRRLIDEAHDEDNGPITWFAVDQTRSSAHRPWNQDGIQLPLVHTARAEVQVRFSDFAALGRFVVQASEIDGFTVGRISWELTEVRRREIEREARQESVRNAKAIAQDYADALDLGPVTICSITGEGASYVEMRHTLMPDGGMPGGSSLGEDLLEPEDVEVSSSVRAGFVIGQAPD